MGIAPRWAPLGLALLLATFTSSCGDDESGGEGGGSATGGNGTGAALTGGSNTGTDTSTDMCGGCSAPPYCGEPDDPCSCGCGPCQDWGGGIVCTPEGCLAPIAEVPECVGGGGGGGAGGAPGGAGGSGGN